jgi:hypothetical protein
LVWEKKDEEERTKILSFFRNPKISSKCFTVERQVTTASQREK